jgi:hypothetical protein
MKDQTRRDDNPAHQEAPIGEPFYLDVKLETLEAYRHCQLIAPNVPAPDTFFLHRMGCASKIPIKGKTWTTSHSAGQVPRYYTPDPYLLSAANETLLG